LALLAISISVGMIPPAVMNLSPGVDRRVKTRNQAGQQ
jgi:hypothetical protein